MFILFSNVVIFFFFTFEGRDIGDTHSIPVYIDRAVSRVMYGVKGQKSVYRPVHSSGRDVVLQACVHSIFYTALSRLPVVL